MYFASLRPFSPFTSNPNTSVNRSDFNPKSVTQTLAQDQLILRRSSHSHAMLRFSGQDIVVRMPGFDVTFWGDSTSHSRATKVKVVDAQTGGVDNYTLPCSKAEAGAELRKWASEAEAKAAKQSKKIVEAQEKRRNLSSKANELLTDANYEADRIASKTSESREISDQIQVLWDKANLARRFGHELYRDQIRYLETQAETIEKEIRALDRARVKERRRREIRDLRAEAVPLLAQVKSLDNKIADYKVEEAKYTRKANLYRSHAQIVSDAYRAYQDQERQRLIDLRQQQERRRLIQEEERLERGHKAYVAAIENKAEPGLRAEIWRRSLPYADHFDSAF